jgi:hypothetical protein
VARSQTLVAAIYRGLTYQQLLLGAALPDAAALAWAVHDLGIWTAGSFDYLTPSADLASMHAAEFGVTDIERISPLAWWEFGEAL